jgi:ABC-type lipoprotein export system ATPase subunit
MPVSPLPDIEGPRTLHLEGVRVHAGGVTILEVPKLEVAAGAHLGVAGVSGSGKTTLLHVIAGLRRPDAGRVVWGGLDVARLQPVDSDAWRRATVGLVFQDFQLIGELTALENVLLPLSFKARHVPAQMHERAEQLLLRMGVAPSRQRVGRLSRGEQQRVAIARACLHQPPLLLADEPTASLDAAAAGEVVELLVSVAASSGATLIVVSHDPGVLARMSETYQLGRPALESVALESVALESAVEASAGVASAARTIDPEPGSS